MNTLKYARNLVAGLLIAFAPAALAQHQTLTLLDRTEMHEGMTAHAGYLWVGKSRGSFTLEIYDAELSLAGMVTLPHGLTYVHPYDATSVIVVGTAVEPNLTYYSIVRVEGGRFSTVTRQIPVDAWADHWLGSVGGKEYFTDMGGNPNDSAGDADPTLPAQTFFRIGARGAPSYLPVRLRMPLAGVKIGEEFFLIHAQDGGSAATNLVRLNPNAATATILYPRNLNHIQSIVNVPGTGLIGLGESGASQVRIFDATAGVDRSTIHVGGFLRSLATYGHCIYAASDEDRTVTAINVADIEHPSVVSVMPIDLPQSEFKMLNKIAVDGMNGNLFARSNYPCNPMATICNQDYNRVILMKGDAVEVARATCR